MNCKLIIKDPFLKEFVGEEFNSLDDFIAAFGNSSIKYGIVPTEHSFDLLEAKDDGVYLNGTLFKPEAYVKSFLKGLISSSFTSEEFKKILERLKDLNSEQLVEVIEFASPEIKEDLTENLEQAQEELRYEEAKDLLLNFESAKVPVVEANDSYIYTMENRWQHSDSTVLEQDSNEAVRKLSNILSQFGNTLALSGKQYYLSPRDDSEWQSFQFKEFSRGEVLVVFEKVGNEFVPVYFKPNGDSDPRLTGALSYTEGNGFLRLGFNFPDQSLNERAVKNPEKPGLWKGVEFKDKLRRQAVKGEELYYPLSYETRDFRKNDRPLPLLPLSEVLEERMSDVKLNFELSGKPVVEIDGAIMPANLYNLKEEEVEEILTLLQQEYNEVELEKVLNYLNGLFDRSTKQSQGAGDIFFKKNGNKVKLVSRIKFEGNRIIRLEKPDYLVSVEEYKKLLTKSFLSFNSQWFETKPKYIWKDKLKFSTESGKDFYLDHMLTSHRLIRINGKAVYTLTQNLFIKDEAETFTFNEEKFNTFSFEKVFEKLKNPKDKRLKNFYRLIENLAEEPEISTLLNNLVVEESGVITAAFSNSRIFINKETLNSNPETASLFFLHEVIHALSSKWVKENPESEIVKRLEQVKAKVDTSKSKAFDNYRGRSVTEIFTMLIDKKALTELDKLEIFEESLLSQFIRLVGEIFDALFGKKVSNSDILLKDFVEAVKQREVKEIKVQFGKETLTFEDTGTNDEIEFFSPDAQFEQERKDKLKKEILKSISLFNLVSDFNDLFIKQVMKSPDNFEKFVSGKLEAKAMLEEWKKVAGKVFQTLNSENEKRFWSLFSNEYFDSALELWLENTKIAKAVKIKNSANMVKEFLEAVDLVEEEEFQEDTLDIATEGDETTSSKLENMFDKKQLSSFEEANRFIRVLVKMVPRFEKTDLEYTRSENPENTKDWVKVDGFVPVYFKLQRNSTGVSEQSDAVDLWNKLQLHLAGLDSFDQMLKVLEDNKFEHPEYQVLLNWLKVISEKPSIYLKIQRGFESSFHRYYVPLILVKEEFKKTERVDFLDENGEPYINEEGEEQGRKVEVVEKNLYTIVEGQSPENAAWQWLESKFGEILTDSEFSDFENKGFLMQEYISDPERRKKFKSYFLKVFSTKVNTREIEERLEDVFKWWDEHKRISRSLANPFSVRELLSVGTKTQRAAFKIAFKEAIAKTDEIRPFKRSSMVKTAKGENQSLFQLPNAISSDIKSYNNSNIETLEKNNPRTLTSWFKRSISRARFWDKKGNKTSSKIQIFALGGLSGSKKTDLVSSSPGDYMVTNLKLFVSEKYMENTRAEMATTSLGIKWGDNHLLPMDKQGVNYDIFTEAVFNYFKAEVESIVSIHRDPKALAFYKKTKREGFIYFKEFKNISNIYNKLLEIIEQGASEEALLNFYEQFEEVIKKDSLDFLQEDVNFFLKEFFEKVNPSERFVVTENKNRRAATPKEIFNLPQEMSWEALAKWFVANSQLSKTEEILMFHGDIRIFDKYFKRAKSIQSTGKKLTTGSEQIAESQLELNNPKFSFGASFNTSLQLGTHGDRVTFGTAVISDDERPSSESQNIQDGIQSSAYSYFKSLGGNILNSVQKTLESFARQSKKYDNVNVADGAGYIHPDFNRILGKHYDSWNDEKETVHRALLLDFIRNPEKFFTEEELKGLNIKRELTEEERQIVSDGEKLMLKGKGPLNIRKLSIRSSVANDNQGQLKENFDKFALIPLYPQFISDKPLARKMFLQMMRENIGYIKHSSGQKLKLDVPVKQIDYQNLDFDNFGESRYELFFDRLFEQIQDADKVKDKKTFGSQVRKLIFSGLKNLEGKPISTQLNSGQWITNLFKYSGEIEDKILTSFGAKRVNGIWNYDSLDVEKIVDQLISRLVEEGKDSDNVVQFLEKLGSGDYKGAEALMDPAKLQNVIANIVKQVSQQKVNGTMFVQSGSSIFSTGESRGTNDLKTYRYSPDGTKKAECKITLVNDFTNLLNLPEVREKRPKSLTDKLAVLNSLLKDENFVNKYEKQLTVVGYRIPTQGYNSMEAMIVREFIHPALGSTVIMHPEVTTQSGTDYDFDKMNIFLPSLDDNGNLYLDYESKSEEELLGEIEKLKEKEAEVEEQAKLYLSNKSDFSKTIALVKEEKEDFLQEIKSLEKDWLEENSEAIKSKKKEYKDTLNLLYEGIKDLENTPEAQAYKTWIESKEERRKLKERLILRRNPSWVTQNKLIQTLDQFLTAPENFWRLMLPNSADFLLLSPEDSEKLGEQVGVIRSRDSVIGLTVQKDGVGPSPITWRKNYFAWNIVKLKDLLGVAAVWNTFYSIIQNYDIQLSEYYSVDKLVGKTDKPSFPLTEAYGEYPPALKSEIISQFVNATVDGASDPTLGYYNYTLDNFGAVMYAIAIKGFHPQRIHDIYHCPANYKYSFLKESKGASRAIRQLLGIDFEYTQVDRGGKSVNVPVYNIENSNFKDSILEVLNNIKEGKLTVPGVLVKKNTSLDKILQELVKEEKGLIALVEELGNLNPEFKLTNLKEIDLNAQLENLEQVSDLAYYISLVKEANMMRTVQASVNKDTSADSSIFKADQRFAQEKRALSDKLLSQESFDRLYSSKSFPAAFDTSNLVTNLFEKTLPLLSNPAYSRLIRSYLGNEDLMVKKEDLVKKANNDFLLFLAQNGVDVPLMKSNDGTNYPTNLGILGKELLMGKYRHILQKNREAVSKILGSKNPRLLEILVPRQGKAGESLIHNMALNMGFENDVEAKNKLKAEFAELLNHPNETVSRYAKLLVYLGINQSGWTKSPIYFSDVIPEEFSTPILQSAFDKFQSLDSETQLQLVSIFSSTFEKINSDFIKRKKSTGSWRFKNYYDQEVFKLLNTKKQSIEVKEKKSTPEVNSGISTTIPQNENTNKESEKELVDLEKIAKKEAFNILEERRKNPETDEDWIADYFLSGGKLSSKSFSQNFDKNWIQSKLNFIDNKRGKSLDLVVSDISRQANREISESKVIEFVSDYNSVTSYWNTQMDNLKEDLLNYYNSEDGSEDFC